MANNIDNIEMSIDKDILVSIVIISYNSSDYILETLESIKSQSYKKLELIISDDCSTDNTIDKCKEWLKENKQRFFNSKIISVVSNTGVAANANRGVREAKGKWLKLCAGDDLLLDDCISDNMNFIRDNVCTEIVVSNSLVFLDKSSPRKIISTLKPLDTFLLTESVSALDQYKAMLKRYIEGTPSFFLSSNVFKKIEYDENFPFLEDYPFALNATKAGFKFIYFDNPTVLYRVRQNSISKGEKKILYTDFFKKIRAFDEIYRIPFLSKKMQKMEDFEYKRKLMIIKYNLNHNNVFCRILNALSLRVNPYKNL